VCDILVLERRENMANLAGLFLKEMARRELVELILEVAPMYNELSTSDFQAVIDVKAKEFVDLIED